ncbi:hypothetical protein BH20ACT2_BH20ACT2_16480 [soil metagenome]
MHKRWTTPIASLALVGLLLGGCGDDDDDDDAATDTTEQTETTEATDTTEAAGEGDLAAYCDATLAVETAPEPEIDFESLSPEEQAEAAKTFATEDIRPIVDDIVAVAPEEIADDLALLDDALREVEETGDFAAFEAPGVEDASDRLHDFDLASCEWAAVDVTAVEYAFEDVPATLDAGPTSFEFANEGNELHEMVLFRKNDGVTLSAEELLALPEEEATAQVTDVAATGADPGDDEYAVVDLESGDYAMVCFIPTGATSEESFEDPSLEEAPPHFTQGMIAEFTVE